MCAVSVKTDSVNLLVMMMPSFLTIEFYDYVMLPQGTPENGYLWHRVSPQLSSPNQPYSLREALAQAQSSRVGATTRALRESLHPILRQKLVHLIGS